jgi:hypothetical protein
MSKGNTAENDVLALIFNKTLPSYLGTLSTTGNADLYLALHTADPGEGGAQNTSEAAYTNYARVAVVRTSGGWTVSGNQASNTALVQFPQCGASGATITHVSIGTSDSGAGQIIYSGALNAPLSVSNLIQPQFAIGALVVTED